jgi:glutamate synthase (NADPH) small chain
MSVIPGEYLSIDRKERVYLPYLGLDFREVVERVHDFKEVMLHFSDERARYESTRCIHCPEPPCQIACPLHNEIPSALWQIEQGNMIDAAHIFHQTSSMPEICGRVCPQEILCQGSCVLNHDGAPVLIGALEAYCTDKEWRAAPWRLNCAEPNGKKVAVVGGGPAGLACAMRLCERGYRVTVFDARPLPGGLLMYGIPGFKLENQVISSKLEMLRECGIHFVTDTYIGKDISVDDLLSGGFGAVFIGVGAGLDAQMEIPGEEIAGVFSSSEFLMRANVEPERLPGEIEKAPLKIGPRVVVIGGGDTASDCLRTSIRLGITDLTCIYRRTLELMPGSKKDRTLAREEGAKYLFQTQPIRFIAGEDGKLAAIECIKMQPDEPDARGRRKPVPVPDSEFTLPVDTAVLALGFFPYKTITETTPGLNVTKNGLIVVDERTGATSKAGVFAGGDIVNGPDLVVTAAADGQRAAAGIDEYLRMKQD